MANKINGKYIWDKDHIHKIKCPECNKEFDFRCDEQFAEQQWRKWIRKYCDTSGKLVVLDFDLILRVHDMNGRDSIGSIKLIEMKLRGTSLTGGQRYTFGLLNFLLGLVPEPERQRFEGFFLIEVSTYNWMDESCRWWINGKELEKEELIKFIQGEKIEGVIPIDRF